MEQYSDGSLWAWTGDSDYQQKFSIDSVSYAMTQLSEDSTGGRGAKFQAEDWFQMASNVSVIASLNVNARSAPGAAGKSTWAQALTLKGFPPNITSDGSTTFLAQGTDESSYYDSRLYGAWNTEISTTKLGILMESYLSETMPSADVLAFLTDFDGNLIAASSADMRGWIDGNSSRILADSCGNARAETVVKYFKEEFGSYDDITTQQTVSFYETYQVKPFVFKNGMPCVHLLQHSLCQMLMLKIDTFRERLPPTHPPTK